VTARLSGQAFEVLNALNMGLECKAVDGAWPFRREVVPVGAVEQLMAAGLVTERGQLLVITDAGGAYIRRSILEAIDSFRPIPASALANVKDAIRSTKQGEGPK